MNAVTPLAAPVQLPREPFDAATGATFAWRGHCTNIFARTEIAVTETLIVMAMAGERGEAMALPHLIGQRYEMLARAIAPGGPFATEGKGAFASLLAFRTHEPLRTALCHGAGRVTLDRSGRWTLVLKILALRKGVRVHEIHVIEQADAGGRAEEVKRASDRLVSQLGQVRALLSAKIPTPPAATAGTATSSVAPRA